MNDLATERCFVYNPNIPANFNVNKDFDQQTAGNDNEDDNETRRLWSFSLLMSIKLKSGSRPGSCIYIICGGHPRIGGCILC